MPKTIKPKRGESRTTGGIAVQKAKVTKPATKKAEPKKSVKKTVPKKKPTIAKVVAGIKSKKGLERKRTGKRKSVAARGKEKKVQKPKTKEEVKKTRAEFVKTRPPKKAPKKPKKPTKVKPVPAKVPHLGKWASIQAKAKDVRVLTKAQTERKEQHRKRQMRHDALQSKKDRRQRRERTIKLKQFWRRELLWFLEFDLNIKEFALLPDLDDQKLSKSRVFQNILVNPFQENLN
jgi:hypothetical protein